MYGDSIIDRRKQKAPVGLYVAKRSTDDDSISVGSVLADEGINLVEAAMVAAVVLATDSPAPTEADADSYDGGSYDGDGGSSNSCGGGGGD